MTKTRNKYDVFYTYKITNVSNGKIYIGETHNFNTRLKKHFASARCGSETYLHRSIRKHGENSFIIEQVGAYKTEREALDAEITLIAKHQSNKQHIGYNLTSGGDKPIYSDAVINDMREKSINLWKDKKFILKCFMSKTGLTISDLWECRELHYNGLTFVQIAEIFEVYDDTVSKILRGLSWREILPFEPIEAEKPYDEKTIYKVRKLAKKGSTYKEISAVLDIPISTISKMAKGRSVYSKYIKVPPIKENLSSYRAHKNR